MKYNCLKSIAVCVMDALRIARLENSKITSLSNDEIWEIMELADMLALEFSAKNCDRILSSRLNANNCIEVCGLADTFSRQTLVRDAVYVILDNWIGRDIEQFVNFKILKPNNIYIKHNELSNELPINKTPATIPMELLNTRISRLAFQHSESLEGLLSGFIISHQFYFVGGFGYRPQSKC
uniref:Uncharacterized protein n=1 Tax=Ciona savignyi TaxID=51511 RepID=H2YCS6_CIOSA